MRLILWFESKMDSLIKQGITDKRFHPPHTTIHIGQVNGGIAPNVIADKVHFCWDIRTIPKDSIDQIVSEFKEYCRKREKVLRENYSKFKIENIENHPVVPHLDTKVDDEELYI